MSDNDPTALEVITAEKLDQIMSRADGWWPIARDIILGVVTAQIRQVRAESHRAGYEAARQDMVSGAFIGGPTFEALRDSHTGRQIAAEAWQEGLAAGLREASNLANGAVGNPPLNPYGRRADRPDRDREHRVR